MNEFFTFLLLIGVYRILFNFYTANRSVSTSFQFSTLVHLVPSCVWPILPCELFLLLLKAFLQNSLESSMVFSDKLVKVKVLEILIFI
jgi:hypothetical protein